MTHTHAHIPNGWRETTLGEVSDFQYGLGESAQETGEYLYIRITDINTDGSLKNSGLVYISKDKVSEKDILKKGDILVARTGASFGKSYIFKEDIKSTFGGFLIRLILDESKINNYFLFSFMRTQLYWGQANNLVGGGAQPQFNANVICNINFLLPSLPEQKAIADILSSLDAKIELLREQNQTLEKTAQTIFQEWFGKYIVDEPESLPEGWRVYEFKEIVKQIKPGTNYQPERVETGIPFVNGRNVQNGFLDLSDVKYISLEEYKRVHSSWIPEENDILITRIGTLGNVGVINKNELPLAVHYNNINIKCEKLPHQFIYFLLKSEYFLFYYHLRKKQAVQEYITIEDVESIPIILPKNLPDIEVIIFIELFDKIKNNYLQIQSLSKTRDTLLPKLMSGEVRVV